MSGLVRDRLIVRYADDFIVGLPRSRAPQMASRLRPWAGSAAAGRARAPKRRELELIGIPRSRSALKNRWQAVARAPTSREEKRGGVTCGLPPGVETKQGGECVRGAPLNKARGRWEQGRPAGIESPDASSTSSPFAGQASRGPQCCCGKAGFDCGRGLIATVLRY
jgi:hypothetical protein